MCLGVAVVLSGCAVIDKMDGMSQAKELRSSGLPAQGTILQIWDTGTTVNDDPVVGFLLEVRPEGETPFQAKTKILVSRLAVPQIQPGAVVTVRYDPKDRTRVSLDLDAFGGEGGGSLGPALPPPPRAADVEAEKQHLLTTGVAGTLTILESRSLGLFDADGRPVYDLRVNVEVPSHRSFSGPVRVGVAKEHEHSFRVGQKLPIKADPSDPTHFAVDWESAGQE